MGGEGYAFEGAASDTALAQLRSRENLARSDFPRRSPSEIYELSPRCVEDCMEMAGLMVVTLVPEVRSRPVDDPVSLLDE
jgi:hypothetical protein